jgi:hypothetical protein
MHPGLARTWRRAIGALALFWGLASAAGAVTVAVTVVDGAVNVDPVGITLAPTDDAIVFQLGTAGYTFPASGAVVITGTGSSFRCATAPSKIAVSCKKSGTGNGTQQTYQILVLPPSTTKPLPPPPDIWIVSN